MLCYLAVDAMEFSGREIGKVILTYRETCVTLVDTRYFQKKTQLHTPFDVTFLPIQAFQTIWPICIVYVFRPSNWTWEPMFHVSKNKFMTELYIKIYFLSFTPFTRMIMFRDTHNIHCNDTHTIMNNYLTVLGEDIGINLLTTVFKSDFIEMFKADIKFTCISINIFQYGMIYSGVTFLLPLMTLTLWSVYYLFDYVVWFGFMPINVTFVCHFLAMDSEND